MVFSLFYRLISLEDQTPNSERMKNPSTLLPPETIKMLPICLVLIASCHLTTMPSGTLSGVQRYLPWEYSLHLLIILKSELHVYRDSAVRGGASHTSISICFTVDLHEKPNQRQKLKSVKRCRLRSDCCVRSSVVSHGGVTS